MPSRSRCAATVSLASSMNSSMMPVRDVALRGDDRLDGAGVVDDHLGFRQVEVDRAAAAAPAVEDLEQRAHPLEGRDQRRVLGAERRIAVGDDGVDRRVGHPRPAVDDPVVQFVAHHLAAAVDLHQARLHQPVDVGIQAAHAGRQLAREHVDGALRESRPRCRGRSRRGRARCLRARSAPRRRCARRASSGRWPAARSRSRRRSRGRARRRW